MSDIDRTMNESIVVGGKQTTLKELLYHAEIISMRGTSSTEIGLATALTYIINRLKEEIARAANARSEAQ